jgi:hypothetical protein
MQIADFGFQQASLCRSENGRILLQPEEEWACGEAVYAICDRHEVLYVGETVNLSVRMTNNYGKGRGGEQVKRVREQMRERGAELQVWIKTDGMRLEVEVGKETIKIQGRKRIEKLLIGLFGPPWNKECLD